MAIDRGAVPLADNEPLESVTRIVEPSASLTPTRPPAPGGAIASDSPFYIHRAEDDQLTKVLKEDELVVFIYGPRQTGKSSLAIRALSEVQARGAVVLRLDCAAMGASTLGEVLLIIAEELARRTEIRGIDRRTFLEGTRADSLAAFNNVVTHCSERVLIALDEVDILQNLERGSAETFLQYLRGYYDQAAFNRNTRNVSFLLTSFLAPYWLAAKVTRASPFNIGYHFRLGGFSEAQATQVYLNYGLGLNASERKLLQSFTGGHPFLVHQCGHLLSGGLSVRRLVNEEDEYPARFGVHLYPLYHTILSDDMTSRAFERFIETGRLKAPVTLGEIGYMNDFGVTRFNRRRDVYVFAAGLYKRFFSRPELGQKN